MMINMFKEEGEEEDIYKEIDNLYYESKEYFIDFIYFLLKELEKEKEIEKRIIKKYKIKQKTVKAFDKVNNSIEKEKIIFFLIKYLNIEEMEMKEIIEFNETMIKNKENQIYSYKLIKMIDFEKIKIQEEENKYFEIYLKNIVTNFEKNQEVNQIIDNLEILIKFIKLKEIYTQEIIKILTSYLIKFNNINEKIISLILQFFEKYFEIFMINENEMLIDYYNIFSKFLNSNNSIYFEISFNILLNIFFKNDGMNEKKEKIKEMEEEKNITDPIEEMKEKIKEKFKENIINFNWEIRETTLKIIKNMYQNGEIEILKYIFSKDLEEEEEEIIKTLYQRLNDKDNFVKLTTLEIINLMINEKSPSIKINNETAITKIIKMKEENDYFIKRKQFEIIINFHFGKGIKVINETFINSVKNHLNYIFQNFEYELYEKILTILIIIFYSNYWNENYSSNLDKKEISENIEISEIVNKFMNDLNCSDFLIECFDLSILNIKKSKYFIKFFSFLSIFLNKKLEDFNNEDLNEDEDEIDFFQIDNENDEKFLECH
jgi:hypothetical protein